MKKIYNTPSMKIAELDIEGMIAESIVTSDEYANTSGNEDEKDVIDNDSRNFTNLWDKEW